MRARRFDVAIVEPDEGAVVLRVRGEADAVVGDRLRAELERAQGSRRDVRLDLSDCEFLDSSALALILLAHREMAREDRQLTLHGASGQVGRLLRVTGLNGSPLVAQDGADATFSAGA